MADSSDSPQPGKITWTPPSTKFWTLADARKMMAALRASGLSTSQFVKRHGLTPQRYYYWRAKLAQTDVVEARSVTKLAVPIVRELKVIDRAEGSNEGQVRPRSLRAIQVQVGAIRFEVDGKSEPES